jgi:hypothetical protein
MRFAFSFRCLVLRVVAGLLGLTVLSPFCFGAPRKPHVVGLGVVKKVPYSQESDPSGAATGEESLKIRPLIVDGQVKEWTTGESHDVTDRTFVVRRAVRLNDSLPDDKASAAKEHWIWQRGPWLMVDRTTGRVTALKLPDYEPGVSQVSWFRDYGAYCGLTASGKSLYAVVAQLAARKPVLAKKIEAYDPDPKSHTEPVCTQPDWQREPLRITFHPSGHDASTYELVPGSAVLVEDSGDEQETPATAASAGSGQN